MTRASARTKQSLGQPGHTFDQRVLPGQNGDQRKLNGLLLADDHFGDFPAHGGQRLLDGV